MSQKIIKIFSKTCQQNITPLAKINYKNNKKTSFVSQNLERNLFFLANPLDFTILLQFVNYLKNKDFRSKTQVKE